MFMSPIMEVIELCKTKNAENVSELVFILFISMAASYCINFIRKFDIIGMVPNYVGIFDIVNL